MSVEPDPKMKITIWPTEHFFKTDEGCSVRAWKGWDRHGNSVVAFVAAVSYDVDADLEEVQNVLIPIPGPLAEPLPLPLKEGTTMSDDRPQQGPSIGETRRSNIKS